MHSFMRWAGVLAVTGLIGAASPISSKDRPDRRQAEHLKHAISIAREHAQRWHKAENVPEAASATLLELRDRLAPLVIWNALITPQDDDPFIDACIRWQFTAFGAASEPLSDEVFERTLAKAPMMLDNPRAEAALVELFTGAEREPSHSVQELRSLRRAADGLEHRTIAATELNQPALRWRDFMEASFADQPARLLHLKLGRAGAAAAGGWPTRDVKAAVAKAFKSAGEANRLSEADRRSLERHARRLSGIKRRSIHQITFAASGKVSVTFSNPGISQEDVDRWLSSITPRRAAH